MARSSWPEAMTATGISATAELFDPATGVWTRTGQMKEARNQAFGALLSDGKVLIAGKGTDAGNLLSAEVFDPATGVWTRTGDLTTGRAGPLAATTLSDGRVLVAGGFTSDQRSADIYDPSTGTWAATGRTAATHVDEQTAVLLQDGRVLNVGGRPTVGELFDPATGRWSSPSPIEASYLDLLVSVALPDGRVFLAGGGPAAAAHMFDPATNWWSDLGPIEGARFVRSASLLADGKVLVVTYDSNAFRGPWCTTRPPPTDSNLERLLAICQEPSLLVLNVSPRAGSILGDAVRRAAAAGADDAGRARRAGQGRRQGRVRVPGRVQHRRLLRTRVPDPA